jgi:hypothetical protein
MDNETIFLKREEFIQNGLSLYPSLHEDTDCLIVVWEKSARG